MSWQTELDAVSAYTEMLIKLFDADKFEEVRHSLRTASAAYQEAFTLWIRHNRPWTWARNYPDQPGDKESVAPESNITWGDLFGRGT
jgi:hypothetical protein